MEWFDGSQSPAQWQRAGTLWKWVEFEGDGASNSLDAALALLDPHIAREFDGMEPLPIAPYDNRYSAAAIFKFNAAASRWDSGSVRSLFADQDLTFLSLGSATFKLCGLIESKIENRSGESGSIILVEESLPFAMHIAGNSVTRSWSVPLQRAFDAWGLQMLQFQAGIAA